VKHVHVKAFDIPGAWYQTLEEIWLNGDNYEVGYGSESTMTRKLNVSDMKYVTSYALQYLWAGMKTDEETYTYGSRLREPVDQVSKVIERYVKEPNDRQLTLLIRQPHDILKTIDGMRHEPPCEIMENHLNMTCYFRSWDAFAGLPANIAGIQIFNEALVNEINKRAGTYYKTGKLIFHSKNCHIYSRLYDLVEELVKPKKDSRRKLGES